MQNAKIPHAAQPPGSEILGTPYCIGPGAAVRRRWDCNRLLGTTQGSYPFDWGQLWRCPASPNKKSTGRAFFSCLDNQRDPGKISRPRAQQRRQLIPCTHFLRGLGISDRIQNKNEMYGSIVAATSTAESTRCYRCDHSIREHDLYWMGFEVISTRSSRA